MLPPVLLAIIELSLVTPVAWAIVLLRPAVKEYARTASGKAFLVLATTQAAYGALEGISINVGRGVEAYVVARLVVLTVAAGAWLLQLRWLVGERRRLDLVFTSPTIPALVLAVGFASGGMAVVDGDPRWQPNGLYFGAWLGLTQVMFILGIVALVQGFREFGRTNPGLRPTLRKVLVLFILMSVLGLVLWAVVQTLYGVSILGTYFLATAVVMDRVLALGSGESLEALRQRFVRIRCAVQAVVLTNPQGDVLFTARRPYLTEAQMTSLVASGREVLASLILAKQTVATAHVGSNRLQAIRGRDGIILCLFKGQPNDMLKLELFNALLTYEEAQTIQGPFRAQVEGLLGAGPTALVTQAFA